MPPSKAENIKVRSGRGTVVSSQNESLSSKSGLVCIEHARNLFHLQFFRTLRPDITKEIETHFLDYRLTKASCVNFSTFGKTFCFF